MLMSKIFLANELDRIKIVNMFLDKWHLMVHLNLLVKSKYKHLV